MFQSEISTEFMDLLTFKRVANIIQIVQMNKIQWLQKNTMTGFEIIFAQCAKSSD